MNLYEKKLIDHYHNPQNYGSLIEPHFAVQEYNPSCGDCITIEGHVVNAVIHELRFTAQGCIISKATASLLLQECIGKPIEFSAALTSEDVLKLITIPLGPLRLKCALMPLQALHRGIVIYNNQKNRDT